MGGADAGKAGLAAGDDGSGPIAGADGSRLTMTAGGAIAESAPGAGAAPSRLAPANWEAISASLRAASSGGAGIDAGAARSPPGLGRPARAGRGMLAVSVGASSTRAFRSGQRADFRIWRRAPFRRPRNQAGRAANGQKRPESQHRHGSSPLARG